MSAADSIISLENHVRATTEVLRDAKGMFTVSDFSVRDYWATFTLNVNTLRRRATQFLKLTTLTFRHQCPRVALEDLIDQVELTNRALSFGAPLPQTHVDWLGTIALIQRARQEVALIHARLVALEKDFIAAASRGA